MQNKPALQLINELRADLLDPDFIWQISTMLVVVMLAWLLSRWWVGREEGNPTTGRLREAGNRLAFPLFGVLLAGVAYLALKPFIHVNLLRVAIPLWGAMALVRGVVFVLRQTFTQAHWLVTGERVIATLVWGWLALYITDLAPYAVDGLEQVEFAIGKQHVNLWMILHGLVTVFLTLVFALWLAGLLESRLMAVDSLDTSLRMVAVRVTKAFLTVVAILVSLSLVGIDMTALSVFTGALGVGLGMGLQKIASNYVSGFIILLDRSIRLGNVIQVGNDSGQVTQITTRYTVLRHPGGSEFIVPNESLIAGVVQNQTYSDSSVRLSTTIGVAYGSNLDEIFPLLESLAAAHPRVLATPAPRAALMQFADSALQIELGFWIADVEEGRQNVIADINLAIWRACREHGIEIPFPQREVHMVPAKP